MRRRRRSRSERRDRGGLRAGRQTGVAGASALRQGSQLGDTSLYLRDAHDDTHPWRPPAVHGTDRIPLQNLLMNMKDIEQKDGVLVWELQLAEDLIQQVE